MSVESRLLSTLTPWLASPRWRLAFSGGLDSTVLLHLLVRLGERQKLPALSAIHIHHGLQAAADRWPAHCLTVCERLGVPLEVFQVQVEPGASIERAARDARYAAFAAALGDGEVLLAAQHRDDQAETLLFRLLRGAGVRGLAAMLPSRTLGAGWLVRPLLGISRRELEAYARAEKLDWIEDPSNQSLEFSRNYLRHRIMPALAQRWPQAASSMARSAGHLAEAQDLLDDLARLDLATARFAHRLCWLQLPSLALPALRELSVARQRNLLRYWLSSFTALPDSDHWAGWEALRDAAPDRLPQWRLAGGELHRGNERLWFLSEPWLTPAVGPVDWLDTRRQLLLPNNGRLALNLTPKEQSVCGAIQVRYRQGGEVFRVPGRGQRDLKRLLNEAGLPTFVRSRLPLLYRDGELIAVANLPHLSVGGLSLSWIPPMLTQD